MRLSPVDLWAADGGGGQAVGNAPVIHGLSTGALERGGHRATDCPHIHRAYRYRVAFSVVGKFIAAYCGELRLVFRQQLSCDFFQNFGIPFGHFNEGDSCAVRLLSPLLPVANGTDRNTQ